jgi:hypothetical protein
VGRVIRFAKRLLCHMKVPPVLIDRRLCRFQNLYWCCIVQKNVFMSIIFLSFLFYFCIVALCTLISSESVIYQQRHFISVLENIKIYIKTYIKISPTCFGLRSSSGSLHMSLAKVVSIKSVKVRRYGLCGFVCVLCVVQSFTWYKILPHNRIVHNDVLLPI